MAFIARRSIDGKLVDCQVISSHGTESMALSDVSDDDDDGTVAYSNRTYISPTVRYMANKDEDNIDSTSPYGNAHGREDDTDLESLGSFGDNFDDDTNDMVVLHRQGRELKQMQNQKHNMDDDDTDEAEAETEAEAEMVTIDSEFEHTSDEETIAGHLLGYVASGKKFDRSINKLPEEDTFSLSSIDEATVCSPGSTKSEDMISLGSIDSATASRPKGSLLTHSDDLLSLTSMGSTAICIPRDKVKKQAEDTLSITSIDSATASRLMEKGIALDNMSSRSGDNCSQVTSRTYNVKSTTVRRDDCSSASTCSWTDMYGGALKQCESRSNIVPSLSLNMSTASSGSSTYFRNLDQQKERHGQDAYQEWVKRKERQKQEKKQAAKQERDKRDAETAMRQRLAKERYEEWCRQKERQQKNTSSASIKSGNSIGNYSGLNSMPGQSPKSQPQVRRDDRDAVKKRVQEWDRTKLEQQQRERERQRQQQVYKEQQEKQRKQKSEGAWQNWMKSVGKRPKPVPLNQGIDTLRGTISNIYINPVQWVSNIDPKDSRSK